ncbi:MAG: hypothetical protein JXQ27_01525 [Acidobacteria bacterium]|nr:hypothetical protein [Acidobacteriota bacterium]
MPFFKMIISILILFFLQPAVGRADHPEKASSLKELNAATGLQGQWISYGPIMEGMAPAHFQKFAKATYKPSYNEDPAIPAQCWIETGYGTQNACKYCHTDYLTHIRHGNNFPIGEDQILYSFPTPRLNRILWRNIIHPADIGNRLEKEGLSVPHPDDPENLRYIRTDNWREAYRRSRRNSDVSWNNLQNSADPLQLLPALNPDDLFPYRTEDPTSQGTHGYIDPAGFVRDRQNGYTGWRAVNFLPYPIFTPLTGSVSGIYLRLPSPFRNKDGSFDLDIYKKNLELLHRNIINLPPGQDVYDGDAGHIKIQKGFYPVGTEFAHPLHYVDLQADGDCGANPDGVHSSGKLDYEFPGTRSKRIKEIRYLYKWKEVGLADIGEAEEEESESETDTEPAQIIGAEWKGWIDNEAGWIIAAFIEDRNGDLRPQSTEELLQCLGCHSHVGNTVDAVWSFQRKLPGDLGWQEMNYGNYHANRAASTRLNDYYNQTIDKGEMEYFYYSVVGADLYGVMPREIKDELLVYAKRRNLKEALKLNYSLEQILDDHRLQNTPAEERKKILGEREAIMRHYASHRAYLAADPSSGELFIKGTIFYPTAQTMNANIAAYRRIVLDQSFNLGKNTFGSQPEAVPFTFRSDGTIRNSEGELIPLGDVIDSRQYGPDGVGIAPTGLVRVNTEGEPLDTNGKPVDVSANPGKADGHVTNGGTFDPLYNPIISSRAVKQIPNGRKTGGKPSVAGNQ